jgi:hypothetical protein
MSFLPPFRSLFFLLLFLLFFALFFFSAIKKSHKSPLFMPLLFAAFDKNSAAFLKKTLLLFRCFYVLLLKLIWCSVHGSGLDSAVQAHSPR